MRRADGGRVTLQCRFGAGKSGLAPSTLHSKFRPSKPNSQGYPCSMQIFIRKIPRAATRKDIKDFVAPALDWHFLSPFRARGEMRACRILVIRDPETGELDRHAVISVEPEKAGERVLKILNRARLLGRRVELHEYRARSRRSSQWGGGERRRQRLLVEDERAPHVQGVDSFRRTHGG